MSDPFVVCAVPIRNRAWAVPLLAEAMTGRGRRPDALLFVTGDNEDGTREAVGRCALESGLSDVYIEDFPTGCPGWRRDGEPRYSINDHEALSRVYNRCLDKSLEQWPQATHVWMLDSDVIPDPDVLELLLAAKKEVVAAVVMNSPGAYNFMLGEAEDGGPTRNGLERDQVGEMAPYMALEGGQEAFPATLVSACVLYRREVLELRGSPMDDMAIVGERREVTLLPIRGDMPIEHCGEPVVRFAPDPRSHDFGMMRALRRAGVTPWVEPRARASHYFHGPGEPPLRP